MDEGKMNVTHHDKQLKLKEKEPKATIKAITDSC